jgi:tRNA nucleotidyltransferase (CCA-adding enzyme)
MTSDFPIPADLRAMLEAVGRVGRPRLVGGGVRDWLLGIEPKDFDIEVAGTDFEALRRSLAPFGVTDVVGRSFGVVKVRSAATQAEYDFSLPRRESKTGAGHRGFAVAPDPGLSDAEAAARRDFTVNAISFDPATGELIDPHGGTEDLRARVLRHTGPAFVEDPLRVLRAFQLAARFDFTLAPETAALCRRIAHTFAELPVERVWGEWEKWAVKATRPSRGLDVLEETGWLVHFPEIAALRGTPQEPEWHPEGDVFDHTRHCLDALVRLAGWREADAPRRRLLSLAVLAHDFGKPATTVRAERRGALRWISPGHEPAGGPLAAAFLRRIGAPLDLDAPVSALVMHHLLHHRGNEAGFTAPQVRRLARKLAPATIDDVALVMTADSLGRPPKDASDSAPLIAQLLEKARALAIEREAPRPLIQGRHLVELGRKPGPEFKAILGAAFEAQLDGVFTDENGGMTWLEGYLRDPDPWRNA